MTTRAMGPGAGLDWLKRAINLGRGSPRAVIGGIALLAVVALIPSLVQLLLQYGIGADRNAILAVIGLTTLLSIVIFPLLMGGMLRVIHAAENDRPTRATAIFDTFRAGNDALRLIGFGILMTLIYVLFAVALISMFGKGFVEWYLQVMTLSMQGGDSAAQAAAMPVPPEGTGLLAAVGTLFGLFFGGVYSIGFGQVALGGRGVFGALGDGVSGAVKNLLPVIVLAIIAVIGMIVVALATVLIGGLLALIGSLVHPALGALLAFPVYLAMLLVIYVVMFGVMYHMWRDICGGDAAQSPVADNRVEL